MTNQTNDEPGSTKPEKRKKQIGRKAPKVFFDVLGDEPDKQRTRRTYQTDSTGRLDRAIARPNTAIFGRTDLRKGVSEAKFDVEADFDVKKSLAPLKSAENHEKTKKNSKTNSDINFSASKN